MGGENAANPVPDMKERSAENPVSIPDKLYFRIGEVSAIAEVPTHVLRFWESEFPRINPKRTASGQRLYTRRDVELILQIKTLLYERRFTIPGARRFLRQSSPEAAADSRRILESIRAELESLRHLLD
jgi:DNA-binding transcriptional MerR regulator